MDQITSFSLLDSAEKIRNFERFPLYEDDHFHVEKVLANFERPFLTEIRQAEGYGNIRIKLSGTALLRYEGGDRWHLAAANTIGLRIGPDRTLVRTSRGPHELYCVYWRLDSLSALIDSFSNYLEGQHLPYSTRNLPYQPIYPRFRDPVERVIRAVAPGNEGIAPFLLAATIAETIGYVGSGAAQSQLAPTPLDLPAGIASVVEGVRKNPENPWPLKHAADEAGYSPFHFSRVFKQITCIGFHEFVDRVRTEAAVEFLCSSSHSIDTIALNSGFTSPQGLRESLRQYVGLSPSEIRAEPNLAPSP